MINLKLKQYKTIESNTLELVKIFNAVKLNDVAAKYVTGEPITEVEPATVLRQYNFDRASTLPNFSEYRAMGIDLSSNMPNCSDTAQCLNELTALVNEYLSSQYGNEMQYVSYDRKLNQFIINQAGKDALQRAIITLSGKEEELYNAVLSLHKVMTGIDAGYKWNLLSSNVVNNTFDNELRIDDVVHYIKMQGVEKERRK